MDIKNKRYIGEVDEKIILQVIDNNPNLRESLAKLAHNAPYRSLDREEKQLLHSLGLLSVRGEDTPISSGGDVRHRIEALVSYLYELNSEEYITLRTITKHTEIIYRAMQRTPSIWPLSRDETNYIFAPGEERLLYSFEPQIEKDFLKSLNYIRDFFRNSSEVMQEAAIICSYKNKSIQIKWINNTFLIFRIKDCLVGVKL